MKTPQCDTQPIPCSVRQCFISIVCAYALVSSYFKGKKAKKLSGFFPFSTTTLVTYATD